MREDGRAADRRPDARAQGIGRSAAALLGFALLAGACTARPPTEPAKTPPPTPPAASAAPTRIAVPSDNAPPSAQSQAPQIFRGTGVMVGEPAAAHTGQVKVGSDGGISFNFINADIRDVLREVMGDQLHLGYVVDSKVQATITAQTGGPLPREAVLPALDNVLRANGVGMIEGDGVYRIVPIEEAAKGSLGAAALPNQPGYGIRILPLRFVSAGELKNVLDPFLPSGAATQADGARNLLIVSGAQGDLDGIESLVKQFDVDWLAGTSFALYPLHVATAKDIAGELDEIFGEKGSGPLAGIVRLVPLERLNAILVISPQSRYLTEVRTWIDRLDYGNDETTPRLFQYRVQNSRAVDLAAVLTRLFSAGEVSAVRPETAPGARATTLVPEQMGMAGAPGTSATPGTQLYSGNAPGGVISRPSTGQPSPPLVPPPDQRGAAAASREGPEQELGLPGAVPPGQENRALQLPPIRIVADEKNNALVIYARPRDYRMIEETIRRLDIVPLQVLIDATVAEVTLNDTLSYGLQFFLKRGANIISLNSPTTPPTVPTNGTGAVGNIAAVFPGFNYVLSTGSARVILNALSAISHVNVISSPQLLVLDHQTAALQVGDQVPIITQSAISVVTPGAPVVNSVDYRNTGVLLHVTPRVNTSGLITLDIDQEVSDVAKTTTSGIDSPTITERRIVSSVVAQDGETIALGGLILDKQDTEKGGIPILSDIPIVGALFGTTTKTAGRTELIVLLSPRIIRDSRDARAMTDELRNRMTALKPLTMKAR